LCEWRANGATFHAGRRPFEANGGGAQRAVEAPRFLIPRPILRDLEARGHTFAKVGRKGEVKYGYSAVALVNAAKGTAEGGAEPRRSHAVAK
jgi:hypothetical protein